MHAVEVVVVVVQLAIFYIHREAAGHAAYCDDHTFFTSLEVNRGHDFMRTVLDRGGGFLGNPESTRRKIDKLLLVTEQ